MPIASSNSKKTLFPILALGFVVIIVVMIVLRMILFTTGEEGDLSLQAIFSKVNFKTVSLKETKKKKFDYGVINDPKYKELKEIEFKITDLSEINVGKENLFPSRE